ncbi:hypothetical protein LPN04_08820 [Rugamonas sp. A1-17]|nr:hypothetical protein [Rugamonas sp. A1-17]
MRVTPDAAQALTVVAAKLVLENMVLNIQLMRRHGVPLSESTDALLSRLRKRGDGPPA